MALAIFMHEGVCGELIMLGLIVEILRFGKDIVAACNGTAARDMSRAG